MKLVVLRTAKIRIYFDMTMIKSLFIFLTSFTLYSFTLFPFDGLYLFVFHHYPRSSSAPKLSYISSYFSAIIVSNKSIHKAK